MADPPPRDLHVRNVSLHSRGKTENGSLYLTTHHLIFSYTPEPKPSASSVRTPPTGSRVPPEIPAIDAAHTPSSLDGTVLRNSSDSAAAGQAAPKTRPKEIWVPYPMINHCVLRSSHSQGFRAHDHDTNPTNGDHTFEDSAFPPVYGTNSSSRPSTDSARLAPYSSPQRSASPAPGIHNVNPIERGRVPALRLHRRDFQMMAFHFHLSSSEKSPDEAAREAFYCLRSRCCVESIQSMHAFHFSPPQEERSADGIPYDARREFSRMGIGEKAAQGPGSAWRITDINHDYAYSPTYPSILCVPRNVSDNLLKYGGVFRSKTRIPVLTYLHTNGGSITRSSQPMVGIQNKRNPQDERLVSAVFSSHIPIQTIADPIPPQPGLTSASLTTLQLDEAGPISESPNLSVSQSEAALDEQYAEQEPASQKKIYGSTRRNMIVDARPKVNAIANRATGGGFEDITNYSGTSGTTVERVFLNIANIHTMRKSLDRVIESFANSDYLDMKPNQELLRNSGWLPHIANLLDGGEMVARVVGLGGSHALVHCSDGWDRTSQVAALAEVMLDPFYRSLSGFFTLIQKDFLSFGHKFHHRHGIQGSEKWFEIENERVVPSRTTGTDNSENNGFNKALSGAKNWFDKNRNTLFRQQNDSQSNLDGNGSRPPSPPPNSVVYSIPAASTSELKEHKTDTKEIAPIFHQFLDAVFQLQYHHPHAFEFNERFLRRLFYQAHSGQYGDFLFNSEKQRAANVNSLPSVWAHFLSRKQEFINPDYVAKVDDPLLFPRRPSPDQAIEVRWWSALFGRKDEDMNTPRALAPSDAETRTSTVLLSTEPSLASTHTGGSSTPDELKSVKPESSFGSVKDGLSSTLASLRVGSATTEPSLVTSQRNEDIAIEGTALPPPTVQGGTVSSEEGDGNEGDPLGVSGDSRVVEASGSRLDAAAFARQSAFRDR